MKLIRFLFLLGLFSLLTDCRTIHRLTSRSDSSHYRSSDMGEQWQREIIREYLPGQVRYDTIFRRDTLPVPYVIRVPEPYPVREIVRESGTRQQSAQEETQVQTLTSEKDKHTPLMIQAMMLLCGLSVFAAIFLAAITLLRK
ncbi:hypothetical protein [Arundinibacter roseus]|uniref:Uncharacterized protein n=1 Tax=Arundinibacter roseus TaxID=2070510 RepID=A0A4R4KRQ5_9BACT|nr:hypothetical protein [Arundinibacter roseus]TDB69121.1 hypothetical protein EZE20_01940 [Arundinibacter roseus]